MKRLLTALTAAAIMALGTVSTSAIADEAMEKAIKARKAQMKLYSWNLGTLGGMAKGKIDYDAKAAAAAANNLLALVNMDARGMWPQGSDSTAMPGKTRAKVEAWSTYPKVAEKGKAMAEAATQLASVAGNGLDELKGAIGPVGKACGGCHKPFREEKK